MSDELTHASFFSGVGGLDMGLERAGWRTVSFSEIDPYASAVLAERWPGVPNLGDIGNLNADGGPCGSERRSGWSNARLWTGGFPCQDLSVAGKRRGMGAGTRSGLAYAFLALAERHRPRFVLLENVPGLLSSHGGRDMAALIGALVELGYGVGYRILDARHFGVPQRRRRVFILGDSLGGRAGAERAAEVLSVGSRCRRHPPTGIEAGEGTADGVGVSTSHALTASRTRSGRYDANGETYVPTLRVGGRASGAGSSYDNTPYTVVGSSPDSDGMRAPDGLAGRSHDRDGVAQVDADQDAATSPVRVGSSLVGASPRHSIRVGRNGFSGDGLRDDVVNALDQRRGGPDDNEAQAGHLVAFNPYRTLERDGTVTSGYAPRDVVDALHGPTGNKEPLFLGGATADDPLLPLGLDSHRYRCCGNGVVSDVSEWIGRRLAVLVTDGQ